MALIETLTDNFNDNSIDVSKWTTDIDTGMTVAEANQEIEITTVLAGGYSSLESISSYDLTSSYATVLIVDAGNTLVSAESNVLMLSNGGNSLFWRINGYGEIGAYVRIDYSDTKIEDNAYVSSSYKYLRIREYGGTIYWDYSSDGISWKNFASILNPITINSLKYRIELGTYDAELSTTTLKVDNANIIPAVSNPSVQSIAITINTPTVIGTLNDIFNDNTHNITISINTPTISLDVDGEYSPDTLPITITLNAPTVILVYDATALAPNSFIGITINAPTINTQVTWANREEPTDTWTKRTEPTNTWTKRTEASESWTKR